MKRLSSLFTVSASVLLALAMALPQAVFAQGAGKTLEFDGSDDYVSFGDVLDMGTNNFTLETWVKADVFKTGDGEKVINKGLTVYGTPENAGYGIRFIEENGTNKAIFIVSDSSTSWPAVEDTGLQVDTWYHIAAVRENEYIKMYVNGTFIADTSTSSTLNTNTNVNLAVGALERPPDTIGNGEFFDGQIDEVRIWNVALDSTTIRDWMCKKVTSSHPNWGNLVGYWRFDESSGTSCTDSSPNSNTGTMTNMDPATDRVWSGAALGDASAYDYDGTNPGDFSANLAHSDGDDITATGDGGSVTGIQVYRVDEAPNVTTPPSGWNKLDPLRYWGVFVVGSTSPTYTVTYNYGGHPGITTESTLKLAKRANGSATSWTDAGATLDEANNTLTRTGESGTEYILGTTSSDNSLPVTLVSFTATAGNGQVTLNWTTESETEILGFNIYRSMNPNVEFLMLNNEFIPGAGNSSRRHEYEYVDKNVINGIKYWYKLEDVDYSGNTKLHGPVFATPMKKSSPKEFRLYPNYPNPFNPVTTISYDLPEDDFIEVTVYNMRGEKVAILMQGNQEAGSYQLNWDGTNQNGEIVSSGIYFLRITSGNYSNTIKMIFIR